MRLSQRRWLGPIPAAFILQAIYGLLFAYGVFVSILNDVKLTKGVGLTALFTSLGITAFGILLHNASDPTVYGHIPRLTALLGSVGISAQILIAYGLLKQSPFLVYLASTLVGVGSGAVYVVSIVVLQAWVPESPGLATGLGLLIGGGGSLFGIYAFQALSDALGGAIPAMAIAGMGSGVVSICAACLIERPPTGWSPLAELFEADEEEEEEGYKTCGQWFGSDKEKVVDGIDAESSFSSIRVYSGETEMLLPHKDSDRSPTTRLSIADILVDPAFSLVFTSVLAGVGPGFGFVLAFPRMLNILFAVESSPANQLLFWVTLVGVAGRIAIGLGIDVQSSADAGAHGFTGAKRMNTVLLALQSGALAAIPVCIRYGWTTMFSAATGVVYITFSGGAVVAACLARSIFSPENSTLAFALLGVAVGVGRALFSVIVATCGRGGAGQMVQSFAARRMSEYDAFVHLAFLVSTVGLASSYYIVPSKAAYESGVSNPVFAELRG